MADSVRINGNIYSHGSMVIKVDGERFQGFTSITYADKRERTPVYGLGKHHAPRGRTRGKYTVENTKLVGPIDTMMKLRDALAAASFDGVSYGDYEFEIVVQFIEENSNQTPHTVVLESCVYVGTTASNEEGTDANTEEVEIQPLKIKRDNRYLFDATSDPAP
jgi:hypothetical protein